MSQTQTEHTGDSIERASENEGDQESVTAQAEQDQQDSTVPSSDASESTEGEDRDAAEDVEEGSEESSAGPDEGDVAADYLEELLDIADLDGDIDIEIRDGRTFISVVAEDGVEGLADLVGPKGEVLDALQELTRLAVLTATGNRTRLVLDIAGHRERRQSELQEQADDAVAQVRDHGEDVHLEPMSAYERKIVHDVVAEAGLVSESDGEGKRRHVVVSSA